MKTVSVHASRSYEIRIGRGLLQGAGEQIRAVTDAKKVMLVSDDAVWPLYGGAVRRSLETAGLTVCSFVFPHGESSKCACTYLELLDALCVDGSFCHGIVSSFKMLARTCRAIISSHRTDAVSS